MTLTDTIGTPIGITGDLINGVAVLCVKTVKGEITNNITYLTGVGVLNAKWNFLQSPLDGDGVTITGICGDLLNGVVVYTRIVIFHNIRYYELRNCVIISLAKK